MDGYYPEIYKLCGEFGKPILLHIDPPYGYVIEKQEDATTAYSETNFIFAHANAYNSPSNIETLLKNYSNIYIDFFAGFTTYNSGSDYQLTGFIPLINKYPDRFIVNSDSGFDVGYDKANTAIYEFFD